MCQLAKEGTSFLFAGASSNMEGASRWISQGIFPPFVSDDTQKGRSGYESIQAQTRKELTAALLGADVPGLNGTLPSHSFTPKKKLFRNMDSALESEARKAASQMNKCFPLRRFAVTTDSSNRSDTVCGTVTLREGIPITAKISASLLEFDENEGGVSDYNMFMIVSSLPFKARACMFWNMTGVSDGLGINSTALFSGNGLENFKAAASVTVQAQGMVSEKVR
jgi:hypothetical protein